MAPLISNRESDPDASNRSKRRKIDAETETSATVPAQLKWRSPSEQRIYSVKLAQALQRARHQSTSSQAPNSGVRLVRYEADRALAMAAKGKTRWSRAILAGSLNLLRKHKKVKPPTGCCGLPRKRLPAVVETKRLPAVEKRVKILRRLVPGCKGIPVTNLLEEAGDYIAALEMQVRAMTAVTDFLSGAHSGRLGSTSSSSSSS